MRNDEQRTYELRYGSGSLASVVSEEEFRQAMVECGIKTTDSDGGFSGIGGAGCRIVGKVRSQPQRKGKK